MSPATVLPVPPAAPRHPLDDLRARCEHHRTELRSGLDELRRRLDVARAWRTVPLGADARDPRRTPGVDFDVWVLHVRYQRTRGTAELTALVEEYGQYVHSLARRLQRHGEAAEDVEQVALEALVASLQRFDVDRGIPFAAFATPTITGAIKRHYRDRGWGLRTPRAVHDLAPALRDAEERLSSELERPPTTAELAELLGADEGTVRAVQAALVARTVSSLDGPGAVDGSALGDSIGQVDTDLVAAENHVALATAMADLSDRDRRLIALYYFEELSQREIAAVFGVSQMQVSRWLANIVARLRQRLVEA